MIRKDQKKILQRLREPVALHAVRALRVGVRAVLKGRGPDGRLRRGHDGLEHVPGLVGEFGVAGEAVEDEEGFDCFGSVRRCWWV